MTLPPDGTVDAELATGASNLAPEGSDAPIEAVVIEAVLIDPPARRLPGPGLLGAIVLTVVLLFVQLVASVVGVAGVIIFGVPLDQAMPIIFPVGTASLMITALAMAYVIYGRDTGRALAFRLPSLWHTLLTVAIVAPLAVVAQALSDLLSLFLPTFMQGEFELFAEEPLWLVAVVGCAMPGIGEEIFFRGILGRGLLARYGLWAGMAWCTLLFGAMHIDPVQASSVLVIGFSLHAMCVASKSLPAAMLGHFLNNLLAFSQMKFESLKQLEHWPLEIVAAAAVALAALWYLLYATRSRWICPDGSEWTAGFASAESPPVAVAAVRRADRASAGALLLALVACAIFVVVLVTTITRLPEPPVAEDVVVSLE